MQDAEKAKSRSGFATIQRVARSGVALFFAFLLFLSGPGLLSFAQDVSRLPELYSNEAYIGEVSKEARLDVTDKMAVWRFILGQLPDRVSVVPTENYYYFHFYEGGVKYAGNIRLAVGDRDKGLVEFIYFKATTPWLYDPVDYHATLGKDDGVLVEKVGDLVYRISYAGNNVIFELNDLSGVKPPEGILRAEETYIGPVADESGLRFFLVFDAKLKMFHYVLDETVPVNDELVRLYENDKVMLGRRTGFAFLAERDRNRKLLVGVYGPNILVNNYFDGPFDQLPDNFIKGEELRNALLLARPELEGKIDRLGIRSNGMREAITPYLDYGNVEELRFFSDCASLEAGAAVYQCLEEILQNN